MRKFILLIILFWILSSFGHQVFAFENQTAIDNAAVYANIDPVLNEIVTITNIVQ